MKSNLLLIVLLLSNLLNSQTKAAIFGKVSIENKTISDAIVELRINKVSKYLVTDKTGNYKFSSLTVGDSLSLFFKYIGYKPYIKKTIVTLETNQIDINLTEQDIQNLNEVMVKGREKIISSAKKESYKIYAKDFISNTKATEVLASVPNVFVNDDKVIVDGNLQAKIFIDGIEVTTNDLKSIDVADIDRVEVMNNPSQSYGTDFTGAVVNIISKKISQEFLKGSIKVSRALKFDNWYINPSLSYKRGRFVVKSDFNYRTNNQNVYTELTRNDNGNNFIQSSNNKSKGEQIFSSTKINVKLSEKSSLDISNSLFGYKFIDNTLGASNLNNITPINYIENGKNGYSQWNIASVYTYRIKENKKVFFKNMYLVYDNFNSNNFIFSDATNNSYNVESKNKDLSLSIDYEADEFLLFKKKTTFYTGAKYINRNFSFSNTDYFVNQNVENIYSEVDSEWSDKISTEVSTIFEHSKNANTIALNQNYNFFLPSFNFLYNFKNNYKTRLGYSRKILRPDAEDLNNQLIIYSPGKATQGNSSLNPQIRNYYFISLNKTIKTNNFSLKIYNETINNRIDNTVKMENNLFISTLGNIAKFNATGMSLGIRTKLFKKISANLNTGFDYSVYEDLSPTALIAKAQGYTFRGNINLNTTLFKDKLSLTLNGNQNGPTYSLVSKSINNPNLDFSATTNICKDKINLKLYAGNIFSTAGNSNQITRDSNFYQNYSMRNNFSNISFSITYNFGKKFNDVIEDNNIINDDLRK